jgi:hypothetical protein
MPSSATRLRRLRAGCCGVCGSPRDRDRVTCTRCAASMRDHYIQRAGAVHLAPDADVVGLDAPAHLCCGWWTAGPTVLPWTCLTCGAVRRRRACEHLQH